MKLLRALLFLIAVPAMAVTEQDDLLDWLHELIGDHRGFAVAYSHYPSGRPELVIAAREPGEGDWGGTLWLTRFPDADRGRVAVLQRLKLPEKPVGLAHAPLMGERVVVVAALAKHSVLGYLYRVAGRRLIEIATVSLRADDGFLAFDVDRDGVPELISTYCCENTPCGVGGFVSVQKYDGTRYEPDGRTYIDAITANGGGKDERQLITPRSADEWTRKRYRFHVINGGADSASVRLDGRDVIAPAALRHFTIARSKPVWIDDREPAAGCHELVVQAHGPRRSSVLVLVEDLDAGSRTTTSRP